MQSALLSIRYFHVDTITVFQACSASKVVVKLLRLSGNDQNILGRAFE